MKYLLLLRSRLKLKKETRGQDLVEYALMAGFVAVCAGAIMPQITTYLTNIFCYVGILLQAAAEGAGPYDIGLPQGCAALFG